MNLFVQYCEPPKINPCNLSRLFIAAMNGNIEVVKEELLHTDVNVTNNDSSTAHIAAAYCGHINILKYLISVPNIDFYVQDRNGFTAMDHAVKYGGFTAIKILAEIFIRF